MEGLADKYDVVVIGSGMGGLTCGGLTAKAGLKTLVADKHTKYGGCVQYFGRPFTFDSTLHFIGGCGEGGWVAGLLDELGIADKVELARLEPMYRAVFPQHDLKAPSDPDAYADALVEAFPDDACNIRKLFNDLDAMGADYLSLRGGASGTKGHNLLQHYRDRTAQQLLDDYVQDRKLQSILCALCPLYGLPPSQLSALYFALMWHVHHGQGGAYYVKGGAQAFGFALASVVTESGGHAPNRARVTKILVENGRATGVQLEDGSAIAANYIVSNADPHQTSFELVGKELLPAEWTRRTATWQPSVSGMMVHLGVQAAVEAEAHTTVVHETYDLEDAHAGIFADPPAFKSFMATVTTKSDPARGEAGQSMVMLYAPMPYERADGWKTGVSSGRDMSYRQRADYGALKESIGSALIGKAEKLLGELMPHVFAKRIATPLTFERYTFNYHGAIAGWANTPAQSGGNRPGPETPIANLYQAGHWCFPGAGVAPAMMSGKLAAERILKGV